MSTLESMLEASPVEKQVEADSKKVFETNDGTRTSFYARVNRATVELATRLPAKALERVMAADSSAETLLMAMLCATDELDVTPRQGAFVRGLLARQKLLEAEGGTMTSSQLEELLGVTRQHVNTLRTDGKLLAVEFGKRGYQYPAWQLASNGKLLVGLDRVLAALKRPFVDEWSKLIFFLEPHDALQRNDKEVTPLDALRDARIDEVVSAAEGWGP